VSTHANDLYAQAQRAARAEWDDRVALKLTELAETALRLAVLASELHDLRGEHGEVFAPEKVESALRELPAFVDRRLPARYGWRGSEVLRHLAVDLHRPADDRHPRQTQLERAVSRAAEIRNSKEST
jgi:hypothetical protein